MHQHLFLCHLLSSKDIQCIYSKTQNANQLVLHLKNSNPNKSKIQGSTCRIVWSIITQKSWLILACNNTTHTFSNLLSIPSRRKNGAYHQKRKSTAFDSLFFIFYLIERGGWHLKRVNTGLPYIIKNSTSTKNKSK